MSDKNLEDKYKSLKRLHDSTNKAVIEIQKENNLLKDEIVLLNAKLINCQKALDINKEIMRNALIRQNELTVEYSKEIQILKEKLKK